MKVIVYGNDCDDLMYVNVKQITDRVRTIYIRFNNDDSVVLDKSSIKSMEVSYEL